MVKCPEGFDSVTRAGTPKSRGMWRHDEEHCKKIKAEKVPKARQVAEVTPKARGRKKKAE